MTTTEDELFAADSAGSSGSEFDDLIAGLDPDRRAAFVMTQLLGMSYGEVAEVCAVPVGTIRSRVSRARADLLAALSDGDELADG